MTRQEFIARWRRHTAGVIALGSSGVARAFQKPHTSTEAFGGALIDVADTADELIGKIFDPAYKLGYDDGFAAGVASNNAKKEPAK